MRRSAEEHCSHNLIPGPVPLCGNLGLRRKKKKAPGQKVDTYIKYKLAFRLFPFCLRFQPVLLLLW